mgnify:CR=1 FL=1
MSLAPNGTARPSAMKSRRSTVLGAPSGYGEELPGGGLARVTGSGFWQVHAAAPLTLTRAVQDGFAGKDPAVPVAAMQDAVQKYEQKMKSAQDKELADNKRTADTFMASNRSKPGIVALPDGTLRGDVTPAAAAIAACCSAAAVLVPSGHWRLTAWRDGSASCCSRLPRQRSRQQQASKANTAHLHH